MQLYANRRTHLPGNGMSAMADDILQPLNLKVLRYLSRNKPMAPLFALWDSVPDPYCQCGTHPDIVGFLWETCGSKLPADCRGLIYGCPVLVHPHSGVIFAIGTGTTCFLRLPGMLGAEAVKDGAKTVENFSSRVLDLRAELGEDWYFGLFGTHVSSSSAYCELVYEMFDCKQAVINPATRQ
jgi:hypothetical protein